jgi:PII-like signaling protein
MNGQAVTIPRIYLAEGEGRLQPILDYLPDIADVRGWTVYRGVSGYGKSGKVRAASLIDLALDLPVTIEFFDATDKVEAIFGALNALAGDGHVVHWRATMTDSQA